MRNVKGETIDRSTFRWVVLVLAGLVTVAVAVGASAWFRKKTQLEPLPAISLATADPEVALVLDQARRDVEQEPLSAQAWGDFGAALRAHEYGPEAEACLRNAERLEPGNYRWPYLLGVSLAVSDREQALASFRRAADLAGDQPHVQLRLAEALLDQSLLEEAAEVIDRALRIDPSEPRALLAKARLLFAQENLSESRAWCERAAKLAPDKRAPHLLLAQLYRRLGEAEAAAGEEKVLSTIPDGVTEWDDPDVASVLSLRRDRGWQLMGIQQMAADGRDREATKLLAALTRDNDPSGDATLMLVQSLMSQNRHVEAETVLRERLAQDAQNEQLRFQLGILLFVQGSYADAAAEFRQVTLLKPDKSDAYYNLAHSLRKAGKNDEALKAFADAVRLSPGHAFARANLAELLLDAGRAEEARSHLDVAKRLAPNDPKVRSLDLRMTASKP